jgi:hypothetical protein
VSGLETELQVGDVFAGYRITGVAGRGGMGVVYRAEQLDLERPVALKLIAAHLAADEDFRERFVRETRAAAAIDHPNVIPVYSAGQEHGRLYLAMRFVEGDDLRTIVRREGPLTPARAASVIAQIAGALDAAHARGLIHRDIKPANVLIDGDHAYLTDFGLTKRVGGETTMTGSGRWVGTLGYVAPEQIRGAPVDARADVYALGCLLFYLLTGAAPYRRDSDEATLYAHLHEPPPDARDLEPHVPEELAEAVRRALAKEPDERYPSAGDLGRAALAAVGEGPDPGPERTVARGAAAPGGAAGDETAVQQVDSRTELAAPRRFKMPARARSLVGPGLSLLAGAAVVLVTVVLLSSNNPSPDHGSRTGTQTTGTTPAKKPAKTGVVRTWTVDPRPNSIAIGHNRVWVTSPQTGQLIGLPDNDSGRPRRLKLPWDAGTTSVAYGFGSLWVTNGPQGRVIRMSPVTGKVQKDQLVGAGDAVVVTTGAGAVWVGRRATRKSNTAPSAIVRIGPHDGSVQPIPFGQEGIGDIVTGGGYAWIPNHRRARLSRLDAFNTADRTSRPIGNGSHRAAYGNGQVWVTNEDDLSVMQWDKALSNRVEHPVEVRGPLGLAISGSTLWVVGYLEGQVEPFDMKDFTPIGRPITVGHNPFAIAARGREAWVTNLGSGTVSHIRLG